MESLAKTNANSPLSDCSWTTLSALGVLRLRGADARSFLQGQVSNEVTRLGPGRSLLAGFHNPQGRVIALLRLLQLAPEDVIAVLPRELVGVAAQRLGKYVLRAKVKLADDSAQWTLTGLMVPTGSSAAAQLPANVDEAARCGESIAVRVGTEPPRWLLVSPATHPPELADSASVKPEAWLRLTIAAGEPQVYATTSEEFVAQMLNLDALGAIAFDKGCYTGQEVIARAHYRGRVKRRLQRFRTHDPRGLAAGDAGELSDGRSYRVVSAVALAEGGCEFLAVTQLAAESAGETARSQPAVAAQSADGAQPAKAARVLEAEELPLPYRVPV